MKHLLSNYIIFSKKLHISFIILLIAICLNACNNDHPNNNFTISTEEGTRDNTAVCLVPEAPDTASYTSSTYVLDYSNASEGYIMAQYTGTSPKVKFQITLPDQTTYTYNLTDQLEAFPLSSDSGTYSVGIYENVEGKEYSTLMYEEIPVTISNTFGAYLYPNQYVDFTINNQAIELGEELAYSADTELDVVSNVYNYIISNIVYDYDEADTVQSGYLPDIDETLSSKKGICLDYAALMASILRSQQIPTHLEVGYAGTAYHAWISTYIKDIGWVNGIIQFDGTDWELMDPTFGSTTGEEKLEKYLGSGDNYKVKYIY